MKHSTKYRFAAVLLALLMVFSIPSSLAESEYDFTPCLWFIKGGAAPEATGSGVVLWQDAPTGALFRNELVPEVNRPKDADDVGFVIYVTEGDSSLVGFYSNGASGLSRSLRVVMYSAKTGAELARDSAMGGDPPQSTTSSAMSVYGSWPSDEDVAACVAAMCENLPQYDLNASLWRYEIYDEEDMPLRESEYRFTDEEAKAFLVFDPGVEIVEYNGYQGGTLAIPAAFEGQPVVAIASFAFMNVECDEIIVPETVTRIGESSFNGCDVKRLSLPDGLTVIPYGAVNSLRATEIRLPAKLKAIAGSALGDISGIETIELPEGLERIGEGAFSGNLSLQSITLPRSLQSMATGAFDRCDSLTLRVYRDSWAHTFLARAGQSAGETHADMPDGYEPSSWKYEVID